MDSGVLFGSKEVITQRVQENAQQARDAGVRHIMNLGHGVMQVCARSVRCALLRALHAGRRQGGVPWEARQARPLCNEV